MKLKFVVIFSCGLILGFYLNVLLMYRPFSDQVQQIVPKITTDASKNLLEHDSGATIVEFDGKSFSPRSVSMKVGKNLSIVNISPDGLMKLTSENPKLVSSRGFGESERFQVVLMEPGTYVTQVEGTSGAQLKISVTEYTK